MTSRTRSGRARSLVRGAGIGLAVAGALTIARVARAADDAATAPAASSRTQGFRDRAEFAPRSLVDLIRWRFDAWRNGLPKPPATATPRVEPDLQRIAATPVAGAEPLPPRLTWIGHATALAQFGGLRILTDPMFSERASPFGFVGPRRHVPPGLALAQLPHIDVVLISHNHYDHLDEASVRALARQAGGPPLFVVPLGLGAWMAQRGITDVVELDWWQTHTVPTANGPVDIVLTPVKHWSARGLGDRLDTLWGGYAVFARDFHLFFAGDTGYSADFTEIRRRFADRPGGGDFDLALIPIGAYEPRWFMAEQHVNPAEAVQIHLDVGARRSIGIHWGVFELTDESLDRPPQDLAEARTAKGIDAAAFSVLAVGETRVLPARPR